MTRLSAVKEEKHLEFGELTSLECAQAVLRLGGGRQTPHTFITESRPPWADSELTLRLVVSPLAPSLTSGATMSTEQD